MNIVITKEERDFLEKSVLKRYTIGSQLYKTNNSDSDTDILNIYKTSAIELNSALPNFHQFQWKDTENNIDWLYTSELQFWRNFYSGDSTINTDIVLFTDIVTDDNHRLKLCRTYKIIKAYIGFAKRDLKQINKDKSKIFHANRGLYCAKELIENRLPSLDKIKDLYFNSLTKDILEIEEERLRIQLNDLYNKQQILSYYIEKCGNTLFDKLLESNNTIEFKY